MHGRAIGTLTCSCVMPWRRWWQVHKSTNDLEIVLVGWRVLAIRTESCAALKKKGLTHKSLDIEAGDA